MNRVNQGLIAIFAIQIAIAAVILWPNSAVSEAGGSLLPDFNADNITAISISDDSGNNVKLAKKGEEWVLSNADDYPASNDNITTLLTKVEGVQANRMVTKTDSSHKRLKVADNDFNRLLELTTKDGGSQKIYVGSSAGVAATHVRVNSQSEVYLTNSLTMFDVNAQSAGWIDTLYFKTPITKTTALVLENQNGKFEFEKVGESWSMKGLTADETLNESNLATMLNQLGTVNMTEPLGKKAEASFGLDNPTTVVTITTTDGEIEFRIGAKSEDGNSYIAGSTESPYYVLLSTFTGDNFTNKSRADFITAAADNSTPPVPGQIPGPASPRN